MTQDQAWVAGLAETVGQEIRRYRDARGLSAQQLADRCGALGMPMQRSVLANLENGRRPMVTLAEILVLAKALGVPPIELVFPLGHREMTDVLPSQSVGTWAAAKWFTGEAPFPTRLGDRWAVSSTDDEAWRDGGASVVLLRWHDRHLDDRRSALGEAAAARKAADTAATDAEREALLRLAEVSGNRARSADQQLRECRADMRRAGLTPPEVTDDLAHIDEPAGPVIGNTGYDQM